MQVLEALPFVRIQNIDAVRAKVRAIEAKGIDALHVISVLIYLIAGEDFDMTMTRFWHNGARSPSTHAVLTRSHRVSDEFRTETDALYKKFYPMEISTTLSFEEKYKAMEEWWSTAHERIVALKLSRRDLKDIVATTQAPVVFRDGIHEVVKVCEGFGMPFLVFSAGIYGSHLSFTAVVAPYRILLDVIKEILEHSSLKPNNVHIVSNRMKFGENDICVAFEDPLIHTFNKNESGVHGAPYQAAVESRPNVILMGDSLGDLNMKDGVAHEISLTIGFLNHDTDVYLEKYLAAFDVVVLDDSPMTFVAELLKAIAKQ
ncbi:pyrimidine 5'-nucleotidase [Obelidium mucronatum]|nr:pyrimidine 5'-nucleotidase [Obelidium mucronatum]